MATAREPFEWTFSGVELDAEFLVLLMAFGSDDPDVEGGVISAHLAAADERA